MLRPAPALVGSASLAGGAAAAITGLVLGTANQGDEMVKNAQRAGVGIEPFQRLAYAAAMSGAEATELVGALQKLLQHRSTGC